MSKKIVIIGGVALGPKAASRARRRDPHAEIIIIERGDLFSYAGCGMPFYLEGAIDDVQQLLCTPLGVRRDEEYFQAVKGVTVLGRTEAIKINREEQTVMVKNLEEGVVYNIPYDKLVLGVGANATIPPIEGLKLEGVYQLYNPHDAQAIRERLDTGIKKVVIVGGGLIGLEVCSALNARGCDVTIIEMMEQLLPAIMDRDVALLLENYLRKNGITIRLGEPVSKIKGNGKGIVESVESVKQEKFPADMVIIAVGVTPNIELAKEAGIKIGTTKAIEVNERLQTSDPHIYAGGDCVENFNVVTCKPIYMPLGSTANKHGRVIGDNITGGDSKFPGVTGTIVFKVIDYNVGKTGLNEREAIKQGYDVVTSIAPREDCANYHPSHKSFIVKLVAERSGRLLGAQALGLGEAVKRIDVLATCLKFSATLKDVADLDLGYAPPYSTAIDAIAHAANIIRNKILGLGHGIKPSELKKKMDSDESFVILDVRTVKEVVSQQFSHKNTINIPIEELRKRVGEIPIDSELIILCRTSIRAYEAERILRGAGFNNVKFLDGSLTAWPYPI